MNSRRVALHFGETQDRCLTRGQCVQAAVHTNAPLSHGSESVVQGSGLVIKLLGSRISLCGLRLSPLPRIPTLLRHPPETPTSLNLTLPPTLNPENRSIVPISAPSRACTPRKPQHLKPQSWSRKKLKRRNTVLTVFNAVPAI